MQSLLKSFSRSIYDTPLTLDLEAGEEEEIVGPVKQKKKKKKTQRSFWAKNPKKRLHEQLEGMTSFLTSSTVLKEYEGPPEYAADFYWYDYKKKKVINSLKVDKRNARE